MILTAKQVSFFNGTTMADLKTAQMLLDDIIPSHEELRAEKEALALSEARVREAGKVSHEISCDVFREERGDWSKNWPPAKCECAMGKVLSSPPSSLVEIAKAQREVVEAVRKWERKAAWIQTHDWGPAGNVEAAKHLAELHSYQKAWKAPLSRLEALEGE